MAKVLIISNDEGTRYLYQVAIEYQKITVDISPDIKTAGKKIGKDKPELILLDLMVPDLEELKNLKDQVGKMPLFLMCDMHNADQKKEAKVLGACRYMVKGKSSLGDLIKIVRKHVRS